MGYFKGQTHELHLTPSNLSLTILYKGRLGLHRLQFEPLLFLLFWLETMSFNSSPTDIQNDYPWVQTPLIASAPMAKVAMPKLAVAVTQAGGIGFIAAGYSSDHLEDLLGEADDLLSGQERTKDITEPEFLPVGVGFITWSASLSAAMPAFKKYWPCAVWLFAPPHSFHDLIPWVTQIRKATSYKTKIWVQVGCLADAVEAVDLLDPDVVVAQGSDAGGHCRARGASVISLVPEIIDKIYEMRPKRPKIRVIAAGGISDGRGVAAATSLGAQGCVLGTRFLASPESMIAQGYQNAILQANDGGIITARTKIYDKVRGIYGWPDHYDGRGVINRTHIEDLDGLNETTNRELYQEALSMGDEGWGPQGRLVTYAGTGVGLVKKVMPAQDIVNSVRAEALLILFPTIPTSKL